jgi:hypothetical protein
MLGKPQWFQRRKYLGWGIYPKTYQGWVYLVAILVLFGLIQIMPGLSKDSRLVTMSILGVILFLDVIHIMLHLPRDERERFHEAVAERNALWIILLVLVVGVAYRAAQGAVNNQVYLDPVILTAIVAGLAAKAITNLYLDKKD